MSSFRPGPVPPGVPVGRYLWPEIDPQTPPPGNDDSVQPWAPGPPTAADASKPDPVAAAHLEAARILSEAAGEAEAAVAEARNEGFAVGREEGLESARAEAAAMVAEAEERLRAALQEAESARQQAESLLANVRSQAEAEAQVLLDQARTQAGAILAEARQQQAEQLEAAQGAIVDLAVAAAERIVQGHLAVDPSAIVAMVAAGVRLLRDSHCTVRISPTDLPQLEAGRGVLEQGSGAGTVQLQVSAGLPSGSYIVDSPQGHVDGRVEQQAARLRTVLSEAPGGQEGEE